MKATIDIPDELYRQVKAKSALRGQAVREVAVSLFRGWTTEAGDEPEETRLRVTDEQAPAWFGAARKYARQIRRHDMAAVLSSIAKGRTREDMTVPAEKRSR